LGQEEHAPYPETSRFLGGRRLTALGCALLLAATAAAMRIALSGELRRPVAAEATAAGPEGVSIGEHLANARAAEARGDVAAALSHYRAAASLDPLCVDRTSSRFLGADFEEKIRRWSADLRGGRLRASAEAVRDASYLFRRMYGGCG